MQTDILKNSEKLSPECRQELKAQVKRVKKEAKLLRTQVRRLRGAELAETKERKRLLDQLAEASKHWGQDALKRSGELTSAGVSFAGDQWRAGLGYGNDLVQDWGQRGSQAATDWRDDVVHRMSKRGQDMTQHATDWKDDKTHHLRRQGKHLAQSATDLKDDAAHHLHKQGHHLAQSTADWRDDAAYSLHKQGRRVQRNMTDWKDDFVYALLKQGQYFLQNLMERREQATRRLRKQGKHIGRGLADRRDDAAWQMRKQGRHIGRDLVERKDDAARQLYKRGRQFGRGFTEQGEDVTRKLRKQGRQFSRNLNERDSALWSILGFLTGLLLAGGVTYWFMKRAFRHVEEEEERQIELQQREMLNGTGERPSGEIRYTSSGGTAVATRRSTSAGPTSKFVGVLSTRQYYPIERRPMSNERDLVFFVSEEDARAEGFSAAR